MSLLDEVRSCRLCQQHLPLEPRPILQWHPEARILIAGQAPGRRTHHAGIPFDDVSGERLRDWLGVDRTTFYDPKVFAIVPMGFCFPGTGKSGDLPPRAECATTWRDPLLNSLKNLQLTLVIGQYALAWHLPDWKRKSLTETVRQWQSFWPSCCPLPHPSPRNQRWFKQNPWFEAEVIPQLRKRIQRIIT